MRPIPFIAAKITFPEQAIWRDNSLSVEFN